VKSRVLFVDHVGALGGAEFSLLDLARAYRDTSTVVLFADGPFRERLVTLGIRVRIIEGGRGLHAVRRDTAWPSLRGASRVVALAGHVARLARNHDCIHANSQKAFVVACVAGVLAGRPVIWDLHDLLASDHFSRTNIRLDVALVNHLAVRVIANSNASAVALVAQGGRREKVRIVHNGICPVPFDSVTDAEIASARQELGLDGVPVVAVFGRLSEWKGQHVALEAIARLPDVRLLLVGGALFGERKYEAALRAQAARLALSSRVHFLGHRSDIPRLMRLARVILHTSTAPEPFGRVIVEGMLSRRPVVATQGGAVEEIVEHGVTGVVVRPGDSIDLASAIHQLLSDPGRAERIALAGRARAEARFTADIMVDRKTHFIEEVVSHETIPSDRDSDIHAPSLPAAPPSARTAVGQPQNHGGGVHRDLREEPVGTPSPRRA
jgi:glycosyltransferase involved in cell wall biosynthesis